MPKSPAKGHNPASRRATIEAYRQARKFALQIDHRLRMVVRAAINRAGDPNLMRCRMESRIKAVSSVSRRARERRWDPTRAAYKVDDMVGLRLVCNNLQDVERTAAAVRTALEAEGLAVMTLDYVRRPKNDGYRAIHLYTRFKADGEAIGCEVQIRSLLQNAWGELSRADLYKSAVPPALKRAMKHLGDELAKADRIADPIRTQLSRPRRGKPPEGGRRLNSARVINLFSATFGREPPEWLVETTLLGIRSATVRQDSVLNALSSNRLRRKICAPYRKILGMNPEPEDFFRWVVRWIAKGKPTAVSQAKMEARDAAAEGDAYISSVILSELPNDWRDVVDIIRGNRKDPVDDKIYQWASVLGGASQDLWTLEPAVYADSLAIGLADHYRLRGRKYDEAVEVLTEAIERSGVLLA